jgi:hypothetical protein
VGMGIAIERSPTLPERSVEGQGPVTPAFAGLRIDTGVLLYGIRSSSRSVVRQERVGSR